LVSLLHAYIEYYVL